MFRSRREIIAKAKELGFTTHEEEKIQPGDHYIAWRNMDPVLLTCKDVREDDEQWMGWINPEPKPSGLINYSYDIPECVKVTLP